MSKQVRKERTGWRDEGLSQRHRTWGWDCPAIDIDFLMCEYDQSKAVALVEYKNEQAAPQSSQHPSYRALTDLADRAGLPFFAVRYANDFSWWIVVPINAVAQNLLPKRKRLTEQDWIAFLVQLRGKSTQSSEDDSSLF